jgi:hypothetical protein
MERRASPRYRVQKEGRFCLARGARAGHICRLKDLSAMGARLDLAPDTLLPVDGILEIASLQLGFPVRLRWRHGGECGVQFSGFAFPLSADKGTSRAG